MRKVKQIEIKNRKKLKNFDSNLLKIDKKHYKGINIYYIGYITIKKIDGCENIYSVNPLYLLVNHTSGYIEEKNGNKYQVFHDSVNENKGLLKKYADVWNGIKNEIKTINGGEENNYGKDNMTIKFNSDADLPLNKSLKFHAMAIIIRSVFEEGGKLYKLFRRHFVWIMECYSTEKLIFQKELTLIKQVYQNNVCFVIIGTLKMLALNLNHMFVINVMMF